MSHCFQEELTGHATTIIDNGDVGLWFRSELNIDPTRIGGDAVVHDIGNGRLEGVPESAQRCEHRWRLWRMDHLAHQRSPARLSMLRTLPGLWT
jgi:hypothetical protein